MAPNTGNDVAVATSKLSPETAEQAAVTRRPTPGEIYARAFEMPQDRLPFTQRTDLPPLETVRAPRKGGPKRPVDISPEFLKEDPNSRAARRRAARDASSRSRA